LIVSLFIGLPFLSLSGGFSPRRVSSFGQISMRYDISQSHRKTIKSLP
jgi:hypothetical protein